VGIVFGTLKRMLVLGFWGALVLAATALNACDLQGTAQDDPCFGTGCGPVPICGEGCRSQCGCCRCAPGERYCDGETIFECKAGCYGPVETCATVEACVPSGHDSSAFCADSVDDCEAVRNVYESLLASLNVTPLPRDSASLEPGAYNPACAESDCAVQAGHCQSGLGPCWFLGRVQPELDRLASLYASLGCPAVATCDCPSPVMEAHCETGQDGTPAWSSGSISATYACIVR
jgi:hypothetical protein